MKGRKRTLQILTMALTAVLFCTHANAEDVYAPYVEGIDQIIVKKSQRVLHLMKDQKIIRTFPIALGQSPVGAKQREGDSKTPEGFYKINGRNQDSDFFRSLHISYPDSIDDYYAKLKGYPPGGAIVIHGQPNDLTLRKNLRKDWTQGCIALSNRNMEVVWDSVVDGTPIIIEP